MKIDQSQVDYQLILEKLPDTHLVLDPNLVILNGSDAFFLATFTKRKDIIGKTILEVFPANPADPQADSFSKLKASLLRVLETKRTEIMGVLKYDIPAEDGHFVEKFWSPINVPVLDTHGEIKYILNRAIEITDFIKAKGRSSSLENTTNTSNVGIEQMEWEVFQRAAAIEIINNELRKSNEQLIKSQIVNSKLATLVEYTDDAFIEFSTLGMIESWNNAARHLYGYDANEIIGQPIEVLFYGKNKAFNAAQFNENFINGKIIRYLETTHYHKNGNPIPLSINIYPMKNDQDELLNYFAIARDISEWKNREVTIVQQQEAILKLSTPILQLSKELLLLPIIGMVDQGRAKQLMTQLLKSISEKRAKVIVIDVTGMVAMDTDVANYLLKTVEAARLMGATTILTGISTAMAASLVDLNVNFLAILTLGDLEQGIAQAEKILQGDVPVVQIDEAEEV